MANPQQNVRTAVQTGGRVAITITPNISLKIFMLTSFRISNREKNHRPDLVNTKLNDKLRGNIYMLSKQSKGSSKAVSQGCYSSTFPNSPLPETHLSEMENGYSQLIRAILLCSNFWNNKLE